MSLNATWNATVATVVDEVDMINAAAGAAEEEILCSTVTRTVVAQTEVETRTTAPETTTSGHHHRTTLNKDTVDTTRATGLLRPTMVGVITIHRQEEALLIPLTTLTALGEAVMAPMMEDPVVDMDLELPALGEAAAEEVMEATEAMGEVHLPVNMQVRLLMDMGVHLPTDMGVHLPTDMGVHPPMDTADTTILTMVVVEVEVDIK